MAIKAVNDLTRPNKIVPTLLIFSAYLRLTEMDPLFLFIIKRTEAIYIVIKEVYYLHVER